MDDLEIRARLQALGDERRRIQAEQASLTAEGHRVLREIAALAPRAVDAGISKTEIAERAGISRQTFYAIVDPTPAD